MRFSMGSSTVSIPYRNVINVYGLYGFLGNEGKVSIPYRNVINIFTSLSLNLSPMVSVPYRNVINQTIHTKHSPNFLVSIPYRNVINPALVSFSSHPQNSQYP